MSKNMLFTLGALLVCANVPPENCSLLRLKLIPRKLFWRVLFHTYEVPQNPVKY